MSARTKARRRRAARSRSRRAFGLAVILTLRTACHALPIHALVRACVRGAA